MFGDDNLKVQLAQGELDEIQRQIKIHGVNEARSSTEQSYISKVLHVQESFYKVKSGNQ